MVVLMAIKGLEPGYVHFWIDDSGSEMAMLHAQDFRNAMNERDRLRAALELIADCDCKDCEDAAAVAREALDRAEQA